jgi:formate dehydrogenase maturation protein FdhE
VKTIGALETAAGALQRNAVRADVLARDSEAAEAPLTFAAGLYRAQAALASAIASAHDRCALSGALDVDVAGFTDELRGVLLWAAESAPPDLAEIARVRAHEEPVRLRARLHAFWTRANGAKEDYLSRALLRPYVQVLARLTLRPDRVLPVGSCTFCGGAPWIAARRAAPDADGAQRYLGCALCGGEWSVNRLRCPVCSNEDPAKLASFQSDRHPAVRIEACEICRRYVKSLDLTVDGRIIPEVDDLVSLAMDLWATEQGYVRIEPGLAGI